MKYLNEGGFHSNPLMRLTLGLTFVLLLAFWGSSFAMYFDRMGLTPASVVSYYLGSEAEFRPALSFSAMVETAHMHMPMMGMVLLFLTHLLIFIPMPRPRKIMLISATFASAMTEEAGGWLVRFVDPVFAWFKIAGFIGLQLTMAFLIVALAAFLWRSARSQRV